MNFENIENMIAHEKYFKTILQLLTMTNPMKKSSSLMNLMMGQMT